MWEVNREREKEGCKVRCLREDDLHIDLYAGK